MSKTAAIKHTKLYTFHPQKFQTFKIRTLPTPQPNKPYLSFSSLGGVKTRGAFCFVLAPQKIRPCSRGMMEFSLMKKALRNAFRCANIPSCIVPSDFQAFFWYPPSSISRCSPAKKKQPNPLFRPFLLGRIFFFGKPRLFWDSAFLLLVLQRIPWSV